tara:strand:- start:5915 stop:8101 length:2187 start_codon:yes stop_codon:yes gene_type:complete
LNRACKLTGYFLGEDKEYIGIMRIHEDVSLDIIKKTIKEKFLGKIRQIPPVKSRVKRQERIREIKKFDILEKDGKNILFHVECEGGTYIRKLCLHPNTEILTNNGLIKFNDFYLKPSKIYTINNGKVNLKNPSYIQKLKSPKKLIKLKMSSGINIIATADHEMLISTPNGNEMQECQKLRKGDYLVKQSSIQIKDKEHIIADMLDDDYLIEHPEIKQLCKNAMISKFGSIRAMYREIKLDRKAFLSNSKHSISIKHLKLAGIYEKVKNRLNTFKTPKGKIINIKRLTEDHFYLLGLIASDGNNTKEKRTKRFTRIKFHNKEKELINQFKKKYQKLFPSINISEKKFRENLIELDSSNSLFASIAAKLGIVSPEKNSELLPILHCKKEYIKSFLKGYFDGDGNAYFSKMKNKKGHYSSIKIYCVYYPIIKRLHQMLLRLDIHNKIRKIKTNLSEMYCVDVNDLISKKKFTKEIGSFHPLKKAYFQKILSMNKTHQEGDLRYIPLHYKKYLDENKNKLKSLGGNLNRILKSNSPITKRTYAKACKIIRLPKCDNFIIEKIEDITEIDGEDYVFDVTIPKTHNFLIETGFVSSNCDDLGRELGCGAHMLELRRIRAGIFKEHDKNYPSINLYDFEKAVDEYKKGNEELLKKIIIPAEIITELHPVIKVKEKEVKRLLTGKPIYKKDLIKKEEIKKEEIICVFSKERFIGMYKVINENDIFAKSEFVMQPIK